MSAAIVTGAYALTSSALNYWITLAESNGYSADAYLNTPVGTDSLNFGKHAFKNLSAWNNPSGINAILAWTADPATDVNDGGSTSTPPTLQGGQYYRSYASINVANAVAAIEGYIAINYLFAHHDWQYIDTAHDGLITASELTAFTENSAAMGLPEAGAMAALLGGTATYSAVEPGLNNEIFNENPDDPAAEQRRFNFFDYAADGQLNGSITMNEMRMLSRILLPAPDAYTITDRQRASANGWLLAPTAQRNFVALQHLMPTQMLVPPSKLAKYRNISPMKFEVDEDQPPGFSFPLYTLFGSTATTSTPTPTTTVVAASKTANINGVPITVDWLSNEPATPAPATQPLVTATPTPTPTATPTPTPTPTPSTLAPAGTVTPTPTATSAAATVTATSPTPTPTPTTVLGTAEPNDPTTTPVTPTPTPTDPTTSTTLAPVTALPETSSATAGTATPPPEATASPTTTTPATNTSTTTSILNYLSGLGSTVGSAVKKLLS